MTRREILAAVVVASACADSTSSVVEDHRASATAKLERLAALAPLVESRPPLTADEWQPPANAALDFEPLAADGKRPNPGYNAAVVPSSLLVKPCTSEPPSWAAADRARARLSIRSDQSRHWLVEPACLLETGEARLPTTDPGYVRYGFDRLARTKYVVVLHFRTITRPGQAKPERDAEQHESEPGRIAGDALLYEIESAEYLGGFAFDVGGSYVPDVRDARLHDELALELALRAADRIGEKLGEIGRLRSWESERP